ncbi:serine/threonine-protein kinase PpkA [Anaerolineales bacterium]|nr:serine/threonine-protein kinase PpkA [Anaerolineales bacterium]
MANWTGKTLGKVKIGEFIARGGMAEVYLGEHVTLERKVAVKIMRDHIEAEPDNHTRFEREARVVASLHHPNIIQVHDYELMDGQPCLVMEYVPGASLGSYLKALHKRGEKLPHEMVGRILSTIASAIDYAHSQNMIHRDIKPANVLLRSASGPVDIEKPLPEDVDPVLTDFGLVRLLDSSIHTTTGTVSGTPTYMSPEQARGDKVTRKTDIYSLGVMLYEMLAGAVPFDAESSFGILMKHLNDPPPPIFGVSSDLQLIIDRALAKDPEIRYATAKEMADEFMAVFNGQTVSENTVQLLKVAQKPVEKTKQARPFPWAWAGAGIILLIALAIGAFNLWNSSAGNINQPMGRVSFSDFYWVMDQATITFSNLPKPKTGTHYEVWLLAQGGEIRRNIGAVKLDESGQGQLSFTDPDQKNILGMFDQAEVTLEVDNDPQPDEPSGDILASSVFPPLALVHVRHVTTSFQAAPNTTALIQGLWSTADNVNTSAVELKEAFETGDEELARLKTEEIINQIAGSASVNQYRDWNKNGAIDNPSDGFGLLRNGEPGYADQGYIPQTISHANFAAQAADATESIKTNSASLVTCGENMTGWSEQLLEKSLQLQGTTFGAEMEPLISEIVLLSEKILYGVDSNGNGVIEPIAGEGGADTAYAYAYFMAEMPLLPGAHRIPPPAPTEQK